MKTRIPVKERNDWESVLADWQRQHGSLAARLVAIENEIDGLVTRLFNLTAPDRRLRLSVWCRMSATRTRIGSLGGLN